MKLPKIKTVFLYVTERCNLKCTYCYFKEKKGRLLSPVKARAFLDALIRSGASPEGFEISGGEPLSCWKNTQEIIKDLKARFPRQALGVQTNGLLLDARKVRFLKKYNVRLEIGIDGDVQATSRWRQGMGEAGFRRLLERIRLCRKEGVALGCNMTVHPQEAGQVVDNVRFLRTLGFSTIDVTPAAFMAWDKKSSALFKEQYACLWHDPQVRRALYVQEDAVTSREAFLDMSLHVPGYVLCGDAFLCLPEPMKKKYTCWDFVSGEFRRDVIGSFVRAYARYKGKVKGRLYTHRDYVCAGFLMVNEFMGKEYLNVRQLVPLMDYLTRVHLLPLRRTSVGYMPGAK